MDELTSRPATVEDLKKVIKSLNDNKVDYLLIGGYAIQAHGYIRTTTDIDILVPADKTTGEKVIKALLVLPDKHAKNIDLSWFEEKDTIRLADEVVVDIMFNEINTRLEEKGITLKIVKKVKEFLVDKGYDPKMGARPLRRAIQEFVEDPLSEEVLKGKFGYGSKISLKVDKDQIVFSGTKGVSVVEPSKPSKVKASAISGE